MRQGTISSAPNPSASDSLSAPEAMSTRASNRAVP